MFFLHRLDFVDKETGELVKHWSYKLITIDANRIIIMKQVHDDGDNKWRMPLSLPLEQSKNFVLIELKFINDP